jgi:hypothetical protein
MSGRNSGRSQALVAGVLASVLTAPTPSAIAATGRTSATILQAITVTETAPMSFAAVAPPPRGGTVVLTPVGTLSGSSGFVFYGTPSPAAFHAHGAANYPASVSISTGNVVTGPGPAMQLATFAGNTPANFDNAANLKFAIGATLTINPNQAPGEYTGTFAVTVNY